MGKVPYIVHSLHVTGTANDQCVSASMKLTVEVFEKEYLLIPLLPESIAITGYEISKGDSEDKKKPGGMQLTMRSGKHTLLNSEPGEYIVSMDLMLAYASPVKQSANIPCPECIDTTVEFTVPDQDVGLSVSPSVCHEQVGATIKARLPPTRTIAFKWTTKVPETPTTPAVLIEKPTLKDEAKDVEEKKEIKEMIVTSAQDILHSIGGGVCHTKLMQNYTITNGSVSSFRIKIGKHGSAPITAGPEWHETVAKNEVVKVRVLSAEGPTLKSWECQDGIILLSLDSATEGICGFTIHCELELGNTSCHLHCPTFTPLDVNRNKGAVAIQGRTSVEIVEGDKISYISKVDVAELPNTLSKESNILHAYRYLVSNYTLCLDTTKHDDVEVIIALCESATFKISHTGEQMLYDLSFNLKNTQCQFAKILLPPGNSIWSAHVGGDTVKPAVDEQGRTLLPLIKGSNVAFTASIIFVTPAVSLPSGKHEISDLLFSLPTIDLPITHLRFELWLPESHVYSSFLGGIDEVERFNDSDVLRQVHNVDAYQCQESYSPLMKRNRKRGPAIGSRSRAQNRNNINFQPQTQMQMPQQQQMTNQLFNRRDSLPLSLCGNDLLEDDFEMRGLPPPPAYHGQTAAGIKPLSLNTDTLQRGRQYLFEKLLVPSNTVLTVSAKTCTADKPKQRTIQSDMNRDGKKCSIM
eukprot:TRINITY_DN243_c15_g1_i1.p1 TRINITY_DN243_c15_g1~~TRINITY_DN243_c15_g1_i1.p1  ORF type:complete len:716 (+),score=122.43 TRINITY_DN243_c15_g1_i1:70-2148(+)